MQAGNVGTNMQCPAGSLYLPSPLAFPVPLPCPCSTARAVQNSGGRPGPGPGPSLSFTRNCDLAASPPGEPRGEPGTSWGDVGGSLSPSPSLSRGVTKGPLSRPRGSCRGERGEPKLRLARRMQFAPGIAGKWGHHCQLGGLGGNFHSVGLPAMQRSCMVGRPLVKLLWNSEPLVVREPLKK